MKRLVIDLDETICQTSDGKYSESKPVLGVVKKLYEYKEMGFDIVIYTSRNVRTFDGNLGKISAHTLPIIVDWLTRNKVPYDEIYIGKPWCGQEGFYVDDKAIRPSEFLENNYEQILNLLNINK